MRAFITGSHAYGEPTKESDVDLVVHCDEETRCKLFEWFGLDYDGTMEYGAGSVQFKVGDGERELNLILVDELRYEAWHAATRSLIARRPVTRDEAMETVKAALRNVAELKGGG